MTNSENYYEKYGIKPAADTVKNDVFSSALSDFTHDMASGGAIRHLADHGFTVSQISKHLDYPTSRERIIKTYTRYLTDKGILFSALPDGACCCTLDELPDILTQASPGNIYIKLTHQSIKKVAGRLTTDDKDYLLSIDTSQGAIYHIINERMKHILASLQ